MVVSTKTLWTLTVQVMVAQTKTSGSVVRGECEFDDSTWIEES